MKRSDAMVGVPVVEQHVARAHEDRDTVRRKDEWAAFIVAGNCHGAQAARDVATIAVHRHREAQVADTLGPNALAEHATAAGEGEVHLPLRNFRLMFVRQQAESVAVGHKLTVMFWPLAIEGAWTKTSTAPSTLKAEETLFRISQSDQSARAYINARGASLRLQALSATNSLQSASN